MINASDAETEAAEGSEAAQPDHNSDDDKHNLIPITIECFFNGSFAGCH
jgi:hypothetical protein